jgi:outer membrane protein OmpA-like peptidoglycan-associated protein
MMLNKLSVPILMLLAVMQIAGCSTPSERVILLPRPDGSPSEVVVQLKVGAIVVLDRPYMVAAVTNNEIRTALADKADINLRYKAVIEALPARPRSYLLFFDFGDTQLTRESENNVQDMLSDIKKLPAPELIIIGHTDVIGTDDFNDELSRQRAIRVLEMLKAKGIDTRVVSTVGRGSRDPLVSNKKGESEARNRWVEIRLK